MGERIRRRRSGAGCWFGKAACRCGRSRRIDQLAQGSAPSARSLASSWIARARSTSACASAASRPAASMSRSSASVEMSNPSGVRTATRPSAISMLKPPSAAIGLPVQLTSAVEPGATRIVPPTMASVLMMYTSTPRALSRADFALSPSKVSVADGTSTAALGKGRSRWPDDMTSRRSGGRPTEAGCHMVG